MVAVFGCKGKSFSGRIASFRWERETTERRVKNSSDVVCNHKGWWWTNIDEWLGLMSVNVRRRQYNPQKEKVELSMYEIGTWKWSWRNSISKKLEEKHALHIISLKKEVVWEHREHSTQWMTNPCWSHWQTDCSLSKSGMVHWWIQWIIKQWIFNLIMQDIMWWTLWSAQDTRQHRWLFKKRAFWWKDIERKEVRQTCFTFPFSYQQQHTHMILQIWRLTALH